MISLLALLFAVLIVLEISIQKQVLMPSFAELEREDAQTSMKRIDYALDTALENIELSAADWGNWADAYQFVQSPQRGVREHQRHADRDEAAQGERAADRRFARQPTCCPARGLWTAASRSDLDLTARKALPEDFPWRLNLADGKTAQGLLRTNRGVMMIAAAPVLDGSGGGRRMGMVIVGPTADAGAGADDRRAGASKPGDAAGPSARRPRGDCRNRCVDPGLQVVQGYLRHGR